MLEFERARRIPFMLPQLSFLNRVRNKEEAESRGEGKSIVPNAVVCSNQYSVWSLRYRLLQKEDFNIRSQWPLLIDQIII